MIEDDIPRLVPDNAGELVATHPEVFELGLDEFLPTFDEFNPNDYFITSGDAVEKTRFMLKQLKKLREERTIDEYDIAIVKCDNLLQLLIAMRQPDLFLETEWLNHRLLCIPKNPRM
jgi:hypothetical protein